MLDPASGEWDIVAMYIPLPAVDPRLRRHINHDPRSRLYPVQVADVVPQSVRHERHVPIFDQGNLGSCTGNAGVGCLATGLFYAGWQAGKKKYPLDEDGAVQLYSDATNVDPYDGSYPPQDTGSDGLTIAKVLTAAGEIAGYQHAFSFDDAVKALTLTPFITGTYWYSTMFSPDSDGRVIIGGAIAGGHEYVADELDVENQRIWFTNSWGSNWGVDGRFYMSWADYAKLLDQQGDVTVFVPITLPPPEPVPPAPPVPPVPDPVDVELAAKVRAWSVARHVGSNAKAAKAVREWIAAKGL